jgi:hypothetical protein
VCYRLEIRTVLCDSELFIRGVGPRVVAAPEARCRLQREQEKLMDAVIRRTKSLVVLAVVVSAVSAAQVSATSPVAFCPAKPAAVMASVGEPAISPAAPSTAADPANDPTFLTWPVPPNNVCCYDCDQVFKYDRLWCTNHFPPGPARQECLLGVTEDRAICYTGCYQSQGVSCQLGPY